MSDEFTLSDTGEIVLDDFPIKWVPLLNFYNSNIPSFPVHRFHFKNDGRRIFGVPVTRKVKEKTGDESCKLEIKIRSNVDINEASEDTRDQVREELKERLGLSEAVDKDNLKNSCNCAEGCSCSRHRNWEKIIDLIFPRLKEYYGDRLPCGKFYSKTYGIFRLVSTWNVPGGAKQELIMTSNLLKTAGKEIDTGDGQKVNLRLLPTYEEILDDEIDQFSDFLELREAIDEFGDKFLTRNYSASKNLSFKLIDEDENVSVDREKWNKLIEEMSSSTEKKLTKLKENMNRNYQRPFVLMVYLYNVFEGLDFEKFTKSEYAKIYRDPPRGIYKKILGMVLQQAFGQYECIPVDTWVETFFTTLLGVEKEDIPESGRNLGKFERFVWYTAQLRKTNQPGFEDIIHCVKTGILYSENMHMRGANPLSCYLCELSDEECPVYEDIKEDKVAIIDRSSCDLREDEDKINLHTPAKKIDDYEADLYLEKNHFEPDELQNIDFVVLAEEGKAIASYKSTRKDNTRWKRTDDMSPFTTYISLEEDIRSVEEVVKETD